MKKISLLLFGLIFVAALVAQSPAGYAKPASNTPPVAKEEAQKSTPAPASSQAPTPAAAPQPLATLGQTLQTLVNSATVQPSAPGTDAAAGSTPAPAQPSETDDLAGQISDTFSIGIINAITKISDAVKANSVALKAHASFFPDLSEWLNLQAKDARRAALWSSIADDLIIIVFPPLLIGVAFVFFFIPLRNRLKSHRPDTLLRRALLIVGLFFLRMIPCLIFTGVSLLLLEQNEPHRFQRYVIVNLIYALAFGYTLRQILRAIFSPTTTHLRTLPLATRQAVSGFRWLSFFSLAIVYSYFAINVAAAVRVPSSVTAVYEYALAMLLTIVAIIGIFRSRPVVATMLRGKVEEEEKTPLRTARLWLARHWHSLATAYLVISLAVMLIGVENSFALMLRGTVLSLLIAGAARFGFIAIDKWKSSKTGALPLHRQFLSFLLRTTIWIAVAAGLTATWGVNIGALFARPAGQKILGALVSVGITLLALTVVYEMIHCSIERYLNRRDKETKTLVASARARTLLPMLRTSIFFFFATIGLLMSLSAIGVNIAPLLAGAGVLGVAIGFGSQSLVKDFLTGLFIVAENTIAVGDVVRIGDFSGTVEELSIRTLRLRDMDGSLHILPFSEALKITNMTRSFSFALVDVGVAYDSDLERVMSIIREVGADIQEDPVFKRVILEPIEILGVQELGASSITIRARMRTRPGKQWDVRRLLLLRIKQRFDRESIEIPFPTVTQILKTNGNK
ncbi:MAG: mechanosensitive ion channel [Alphaproteobacteria bacterium]|nr:mechanosensitive ion channel [Alphaproteobacteria bacterium]